MTIFNKKKLILQKFDIKVNPRRSISKKKNEVNWKKKKHVIVLDFSMCQICPEGLRTKRQFYRKISRIITAFFIWKIGRTECSDFLCGLQLAKLNRDFNTRRKSQTNPLRQKLTVLRSEGMSYIPFGEGKDRS